MNSSPLERTSSARQRIISHKKASLLKVYFTSVINDTRIELKRLNAGAIFEGTPPEILAEYAHKRNTHLQSLNDVSLLSDAALTVEAKKLHGFIEKTLQKEEKNSSRYISALRETDRNLRGSFSL